MDDEITIYAGIWREILTLKERSPTEAIENMKIFLSSTLTENIRCLFIRQNGSLSRAR